MYLIADPSKEMIWVFRALTFINNAIFVYFLHAVSTRLPLKATEDTNPPPQNNNDGDCSTCPHRYSWCKTLLSPTYPSHYFDNTTTNKSENLCVKGLTLGLRVWNGALGLMALVLSASFWLNVLCEYLITWYNYQRLDDDGESDVAVALMLFLSSVFLIVHFVLYLSHTKKGCYAEVTYYFVLCMKMTGVILCFIIFRTGMGFLIIYCAFWCLQRQWQSLKLSWYNTCDAFHVPIVVIWRVISLFLCLSFTVWAAAESDVDTTDAAFWQVFLRWMISQGLIWQFGYLFVCWIVNGYAVYNMYKNEPSFLSKTKILLVLPFNERVTEIRIGFSGLCSYPMSLFALKLIYTILLFVAFVMCIALGLGEQNIFAFTGEMFIIYYFILLWHRGDYNMLYYLWSSTYHLRFYKDWGASSVQSGGNKQPETELAVMSGDDGKTQTVQNQAEVVYQDEKKDDDDEPKQDGTMVIFEDIVRNRYVGTVSIGYLDFLSVIKSQETEKKINKRIQEWYPKIADKLSDQISNESDQKKYNSLLERSNSDFTSFKQDIDEMATGIDENEMNDGRPKICKYIKEILCLLTCIAFVIILAVALSSDSADVSDSATLTTTNDNTDATDFPPYPMCSGNWGPNDYLNLLDMIYLTKIAYYRNGTDIAHFMKIWFGGDEAGWQLDEVYVQKKKPAFFHVSNENGLEIVAVRGTNTMDDVLQDISLYTEAGSLQTFSWVLPLTTILPVGFIRDFVKYAAIPEEMIDPGLKDRFFEPVYDYIDENLASSLDKVEGETNKTVLILGHSLGGGVSEIVGAKLADDGYKNVHSFGLNSPGAVWSSGKFGFSIEGLDKSSISVLTRRDPVGMVDEHGGNVQLIECDAGQMVECHFAIVAFCKVYQDCPGMMVRNSTFTECICEDEATDEWKECW